ncbi:hexose kinase [Gordonia sp. HNM0687]|uniref:Hexose kinase n=1 Tax=Gordonia mangrovi TaxID=2665643 RepID=A0A6L7GP30_9ACTN|nr:1-phosphofructokinase family hexose kinase [Gordonia mangrovi]MXP21137.1 hexose kinase [Gordonia mangrovi]UVF78326.1 1-phosphofructokinase family hexose kinase [Gordonia mangrovi]
MTQGHQIVTVTVNPALDIHTTVPAVVATEKMRCSRPHYDPGGGGINVARAAARLGSPATAVITSGGHTGARIETMLAAEDIAVHAVRVAEPTRESFVVLDEPTHDEYRFVLPGPALSATEQDRCLAAIDDEASHARFLVVSGSLPPGMSDDFLGDVAAIAHRNGCKLVVDTSASLPLVTGAFLIKPSVRELRESVDAELGETGEQIAAARALIRRGISEYVVVSLGAAGALVVTADDATPVAGVEVPSGVGTAVGAGDNMLAGILVALVRGESLVEAVRYGAAAGAAATLTPGTEPCRLDDVERLHNRTRGSVVLD